MDNSIYVALSRQMAVFRNMTTTANNLANVNTPGYQTEQVMFTDYLVDEGQKGQGKLAFTQDLASWRDLSDGSFKQTGNPLDVAISGPGYFVVETANGPRYTRAGNFTIGNDGTLMTARGLPVLANGNQRIQFNDTTQSIRIGSNGVVSSTNNLGQRDENGRLAIVEFDDPQAMNRIGDTLYETDQAQREPVASTVTQGAIEMSNASAVNELVKVTQLSRSTSNTAKFIEVVYDLERKTSNAYARASNS